MIGAIAGLAGSLISAYGNYQTGSAQANSSRSYRKRMNKLAFQHISGINKDVVPLWEKYDDIGDESIPALLDLVLGGDRSGMDIPEVLRNMPGYQFRYDEAKNLYGNELTGMGIEGGARAQELEKFSQGFASNEYNDMVSRVLGLTELGFKGTSGLSDVQMQKWQDFSNIRSAGLGGSASLNHDALSTKGAGMSGMADSIIQLGMTGASAGFSGGEGNYFDKWNNEINSMFD